MGLRMIMVALGGGAGVRGLVCNFFLFFMLLSSSFSTLIQEELYKFGS